MAITTRNGMILYALTKLGIGSTATTRPEYIAVDGVLNAAVDIALSKCEFTGTITRAKLTVVVDSETDSSGFSQIRNRYKYSYDALMNKAIGLTSGYAMEIEGDYLYTHEQPDVDSPVLKFVKNTVATTGDTGWSGRPSFFYEAVAFKAAELACGSISTSPDMKDRMRKDFTIAVMDAKAHNLQNRDGKPKRKPSWGDGWIADRQSGEVW